VFNDVVGILERMNPVYFLRFVKGTAFLAITPQTDHQIEKSKQGFSDLNLS